MAETIKVLMLSSDRKILEDGSAVSERMKEYSKIVGELYIVLLSDKVHRLEAKELASNVWVYPTSSSFKFMRPIDAARLGNKLVFEKKFVRGASLITAQDPFECGWAGLRVKRKWRLPLETQLHTDPFSPYFNGFQNSIRRLMAKRILRQADGIRVVNESLRQKISNLNPRVYTLPIYLDIQKIEDSPVTFDLHARLGWNFIILMVARLAPEKNIDFGLKVLSKVRESFPGVGLVVVGSGPEKSKLKYLARKLGLESVVAFEGWQENLSSYYKTANLFLQTSVYEGYGLALVEAGLSGLPIVTTPVGIAQELMHERDALIVPVGDLDGFAEAITDLIEHNYKRDTLRINMRKTLEGKFLPKEEFMAKIKDNWENLLK